MSTIEDFKNAPVGATATHPLASRAMKTDNREGSWVTPRGNYFSDEGMVNWGYTLDPLDPYPASAREALDLAWELAHPLKEGQVIPVGTEYFYKNAHKVWAEEFPFKITSSTARNHRTLDPLPEPEPDWLDAPAVLAVARWCPNQTIWVPKSDGYWQCACCPDESHWDELIDVTPLYPKGQDA